MCLWAEERERDGGRMGGREGGGSLRSGRQAFNKYNLHNLRCARKFVWLYCVSQLNFDLEITVPSWWEIRLPWGGGLPAPHSVKRDWTHSSGAVPGTGWEFQGRKLSTERRSSRRRGRGGWPSCGAVTAQSFRPLFGTSWWQETWTKPEDRRGIATIQGTARLLGKLR